MPPTTFADATDLVAWSDRREAQERLPELIRRLILSGSGTSRVSFRSGEGVQLAGWDGIAECIGDAFAPAGASRWELGTGADVKRKADDDYATRTKDPHGADPGATTFVFVTSRRWPGARQWAEDRQRENVWKDVRAYDADDLVAWLESRPAVHAWLSALLGKHPAGIEDVETWWHSWSNVTNPPTSAAFVLAGRGDSASALRTWLTGAPAVCAVRGDTVDEAIAFLAAVVAESSGEDRLRWAARAIVVTDQTAWATLVASNHPLILIPLFADRTRAPAAATQGHHVMVAEARNEPELSGTITLPLRRKRELRTALAPMGIAEGDLDRLSALARGGLGAVRRAIARNAAVLIPDWASSNERRLLLPALLAGRWNDDVEADREAVSVLANQPYAQYREALLHMSMRPEPPLRLIGSLWTVCAKTDAWSFLYQGLTSVELARFEATCIAAIGERDPKFDLEDDERWQAALHGKVTQHSKYLRDGLSESLTMLGAFSETFPLAGRDTGQQWANRIVRTLLENASTWEGWASLDRRLTLLAEAAPDEFLDAVDRGLAPSSPYLTRLFTPSTGLFASTPYTALLWALEVLAWAPEHLGRVALMLAKLTPYDPGGNTVNCASNSLREIFLIWKPHTSVSFAQQLRVIDSLRKQEPLAAWNLMAGLLDPGPAASYGTAEPRFRDWAAELRVTQLDLFNTSVSLLKRLREDVGSDGERWTKLISLFNIVPKDELEAILLQLGQLDVAAMATQGRAAIRTALRQLIAHHRSFPDAEWALPKEQVDAIDKAYHALEPSDPIERDSWLFGNQPQLLSGTKRNWRRGEEALESARQASVAAILSTGGVDAICRLAEQAENAFAVGVALGSSPLMEIASEEQLLGQHLGAAVVAQRRFASGFIRGRTIARGTDWLDGLRARGCWNMWTPPQHADYFLMLPFASATWDLVLSAGDEVQKCYWENARVYGHGDIPAADRDRAARFLLRYARSVLAVQIVAHHSNVQPPSPAELVFETLEQFLSSDSASLDELRQSAHDIVLLLDLIDTQNADPARLAKLEWNCLPLLIHHERPARTLQANLARDAGFFVECISLVYRRQSAAESEPATEEERIRARLAAKLLHNWARPPGVSSDGSVDEAALTAWTQRARSLAAEADRASIADHQIGSVLSHFPHGSDGFWPHEALRVLIEQTASERLERGIRSGIYNARGMVSKSLDEGGAQERGLATKYRDAATALADQWPRTSRLLRAISAIYESEAGREDLRAELDEELLD